MGYFKNILVHADAQSESRDLINCGVALARHHNAKLKLVDVMPRVSWPAKISLGATDRFMEELADSKQDRLRQLADEFRSDTLAVSYRVLPAPTSISIIREVIEGDHDLVVKAVKGATSRRLGFFGTTAKRLLRKCPAPVLLVKNTFNGEFRHIVAAVDVTSEHEQDQQLNREILKMGQSLCPAQEQLHLLHAWSLYGASILREHMRPEEFSEAVENTKLHAQRCFDDLLVDFGMGVGEKRVHLVQGDPIDVIPTFVAEHPVDLLVMGTVARSGVAGVLMGNTAEQTLEHITCSVLAVKPPGFKSPIRTDGS